VELTTISIILANVGVLKFAVSWLLAHSTADAWAPTAARAVTGVDDAGVDNDASVDNAGAWVAAIICISARYYRTVTYTAARHIHWYPIRPLHTRAACRTTGIVVAIALAVTQDAWIRPNPIECECSSIIDRAGVDNGGVDNAGGATLTKTVTIRACTPATTDPTISVEVGIARLIGEIVVGPRSIRHRTGFEDAVVWVHNTPLV